MICNLKCHTNLYDANDVDASLNVLVDMTKTDVRQTTL